MSKEASASAHFTHLDDGHDSKRLVRVYLDPDGGLVLDLAILDPSVVSVVLQGEHELHPVGSGRKGFVDLEHELKQLLDSVRDAGDGIHRICCYHK